MLIWTDCEINRVFASVDEKNLNDKVLSFGAKFAVIILEEQGWEYEKEKKTCSKKFLNEVELEKILEDIEVSKEGIFEILQQKYKE